MKSLLSTEQDNMGYRICLSRYTTYIPHSPRAQHLIGLCTGTDLSAFRFQRALANTLHLLNKSSSFFFFFFSSATSIIFSQYFNNKL